MDKKSDFYNFINKFKILYSTSANKSSKNFEEDFALDIAEVIVEDKKGFFETKASKIVKLSKKRAKKIR